MPGGGGGVRYGWDPSETLHLPHEIGGRADETVEVELKDWDPVEDERVLLVSTRRNG